MQPFLVLLLIQPMSVGDSVVGAADGAVIVGAVVSAAVVTAIVVAFVGAVFSKIMNSVKIVNSKKVTGKLMYGGLYLNPVHSTLSKYIL